MNGLNEISDEELMRKLYQTQIYIMHLYNDLMNPFLDVDLNLYTAKIEQAEYWKDYYNKEAINRKLVKVVNGCTIKI